jgi:hypothetical protein
VIFINPVNPENPANSAGNPANQKGVICGFGYPWHPKLRSPYINLRGSQTGSQSMNKTTQVLLRTPGGIKAPKNRVVRAVTSGFVSECAQDRQISSKYPANKYHVSRPAL